MAVGVIKNEKQLTQALERMRELVRKNPEPKGAVADEIKLLGLVISDYENAHHPIPPPTPAEAIRFAMEQQGKTMKDVAPCFGSLSRAYEVLSGGRNLSINMIRKLRDMLSLSADFLIGSAPVEMMPA